MQTFAQKKKHHKNVIFLGSCTCCGNQTCNYYINEVLAKLCIIYSQSITRTHTCAFYLRTPTKPSLRSVRDLETKHVFKIKCNASMQKYGTENVKHVTL